jgi:hypothetical protein
MSHSGSSSKNANSNNNNNGGSPSFIQANPDSNLVSTVGGTGLVGSGGYGSPKNRNIGMPVGIQSTTMAKGSSSIWLKSGGGDSNSTFSVVYS